MSEKLDCPACRKPGGSPVGMLSWYCKDAACPVETFRVIQHEDPEGAENAG